MSLQYTVSHTMSSGMGGTSPATLDKLQILTAKLDEERQRQQRRLHQLSPSKAQRDYEAAQARAAGRTIEEKRGSDHDFEEQLKTLKLELEAKDQLLKTSEQMCRKREETIAHLNKEKLDVEEKLNKSYNDTLEQMVKRNRELQALLTNHETKTHQKEAPGSELQLVNGFKRNDSQLATNGEANEKQALANQIANLEFQVSEANRVAKYLQDSLSSCNDKHRQEVKVLEKQIEYLKTIVQERDKEVSAEKKVNEDQAVKIKGLLDQVSTLESRSEIANRLRRFLELSLSQSEEEKRKIQAQAAHAEGQVEPLRVQIHEKDNTIADLDFRLNEAHRMLKFAQSRIAATQAENKFLETRTHEAVTKLHEVEEQLKAKENELYQTNFQLTGTTRVLKFVQTSMVNSKQQEEKNNNKWQQEIAEKEFRLTETQRVLGFVQCRLAQTEQEADRVRNKLESQIANLEFSLSEAIRVSNFMRNSIARLSAEKTDLETKAKELETELFVATNLFEQKQKEIQAQEKFFAEQGLENEKLLKQVYDLEARVLVNNSIADFLTTTLARAENDKYEIERKAQQVELELMTLKAQYQEMNQKMSV